MKSSISRAPRAWSEMQNESRPMKKPSGALPVPASNVISMASLLLNATRHAGNHKFGACLPRGLVGRVRRADRGAVPTPPPRRRRKALPCDGTGRLRRGHGHSPPAGRRGRFRCPERRRQDDHDRRAGRDAQRRDGRGVVPQGGRSGLGARPEQRRDDGERGAGVPQDDKEAAAWYRLAALQACPPAQYNLGRLYEMGRGVPKDHAQAVHWHRLSAEQGFARSQTALGVMYLDGLGIAKNAAEAMRLVPEGVRSGPRRGSLLRRPALRRRLGREARRRGGGALVSQGGGRRPRRSAVQAGDDV